MTHTCPQCKRECDCEAETLYGDCEHDCAGARELEMTNPDVLSPVGWDGLPIAMEVED